MGSKKKRTKKRRKSKSRKKMPANVKAYFKYLNQGMSKTDARKKAGLPKSKGKRHRKWGPGNPLWEWKHGKRKTQKKRKKKK